MAEYDSVIPAGGSGKLVADMQTAPLLDRKVTKSIAVRTDAPGVLNLNLRFTVDVKTPIFFRPNNRLVISAIEGTGARKSVLLQRADGEKLEIHGAGTGSPSLQVVTTPVVSKLRTNDLEAVPGDVWIELILAADAPVGSRTGKLELKTNHPMAPSLQVSYATRVRPLVESRPKGARLWPTPSGSGNGNSNILTLNRNSAGDFAITGVEVSHPEIFSADAVSTESGPRQMVRVELADAVSSDSFKGTIEGWIEVSTDIPERSVYKVPVLVGQSREATRRPFPSEIWK